MLNYQHKDFTNDELMTDKKMNIAHLGRDNFLQSTLLDKYGEILSWKTLCRDRAKVLLESTVGDICIDIKNDPAKYNITKLVASDHKTVFWACEAELEIKELKNKLADAEAEMSRANSAYWSIKDKGNRIDKAVTMYVTGYWGELSQLPNKMQAEIDEYLTKKEMGKETTKTLLRRKKDGEKK